MVAVPYLFFKVHTSKPPLQACVELRRKIHLFRSEELRPPVELDGIEDDAIVHGMYALPV